jgi:hypothetical protein
MKNDLLVALSVIFVGHLIFELISNTENKSILKRSYLAYFIFGWFMGYGFLFLICIYKLSALLKHTLNAMWYALNILSISIVYLVANTVIFFRNILRGNRNED